MAEMSGPGKKERVTLLLIIKNAIYQGEFFPSSIAPFLCLKYKIFLGQGWGRVGITPRTSLVVQWLELDLAIAMQGTRIQSMVEEPMLRNN